MLFALCWLVCIVRVCVHVWLYVSNMSCFKFKYQPKCNICLNFCFLSLDLQTARLVLTHLFRVVSLPAAKKNQQLWAQTLKKPTDTQGLCIELLISLYLSSLLLCLITNYKWTRSISPNKWSEAHFEGGILSKTLVAVALFRDPSRAETTWDGGHRNTGINAEWRVWLH